MTNTAIHNSHLTDSDCEMLQIVRSLPISEMIKGLCLRISELWWIFPRSLSPKKFPLSSPWWNWLPAHHWAITGKKKGNSSLCLGIVTMRPQNICLGTRISWTRAIRECCWQNSCLLHCLNVFISSFLDRHLSLFQFLFYKHGCRAHSWTHTQWKEFLQNNGVLMFGEGMSFIVTLSKHTEK